MRGIYVYTDFHSPSGAAVAYEVCSDREVKFWGGDDCCERVMLRFGDESEIGYSEDFPISIISVSPRQQKFADKLSHRDFLGALMNLGIERDLIGDIIVAGNCGYVFVVERMTELILDSVTSVKHTSVECRIIDELPEDARPVIRRMSVNISSERADAVVARVFGISRGEAKELFAKESVFVGGRESRGAGASLKEGDTVSVRGFGKFVFYGISGETKKGRLVAEVGKYE